jgi:hypothetical protein
MQEKIKRVDKQENRNDLQFIIQKIKVYKDYIEILLKSDNDTLLRSDGWRTVRPWPPPIFP